MTQSATTNAPQGEHAASRAMQSGRVVVVTGAAGGMGAVLVDRFLANGDIVVATDTKDESLAKLRETHRDEAKLATVAADITKEDDCTRVADVARNGAGRVDVLVNCAGYFPFVTFEDMTPDQWRQTIDINLTGNFLMTRAMLPLMKSRGWGRVINYGSGSVFNGVAGQSHYVAAKAGIIGLTRSLARELGGYGITVNIVVPGVTMTEPVRRTFPKALVEQQRNARALKRDELPEDLVGPVFFLASPESDFMTGQMINVDGGNNMY
jgi:NAD(P)-dependent dehydrogenase (short-subunit alcohol dehydrogenase family)